MSKNSFISRVLRASFWATIAKWVDNGLGIISIMVLARLLTPDDFGLVAAATLITAGFDVLSRLGTDQYIIHKKDLDVSTINTAWTIQLIVKFGIFVLLITTSLILPHVIEEQRLPPILMTLAIIPLLMGMSNIGLVLLRKELEFKKIAKLESTAKILSFILTVSVAYGLKNYWAFICGMVFYYFIIFIGSYLISYYRPKLTLIKSRAQFSFSTWTLLKGVVNYINGKIDQMLVTNYLSVSQFGLFSIGQRLNSIPNQLLISPVSTALFSGLAHSLNNMDEFSERVHKTLFLVFLFTVPFAICLRILAPHLVPIALGDDAKWIMVVDILKLLAPIMIVSALSGNIFNIFTLLGKVKYLFYFELVSAITSAFIFISILETSDERLFDLLQAKVLLSSSFLVIILISLARQIELSFLRLSISVTVIAGCGWLTYLCSIYFYQYIHNLNAFLIIIFMSILVMLLYSSLCILVIYFLRSTNKDFKFFYEKIKMVTKVKFKTPKGKQ